MKKNIIIYFLLLIGQLIFAQSNDLWTSYRDKDSDLIGYKNSKGEIMIEPKFMGLTFAKKFENIILAIEENNGNYDAYYLTKSGKKVGKDSLYFSGNVSDCESEGFIKFREKKTGKVGMFNKNGNVAIPAIYNELSRVQNGLIWALKGAEKQFCDKYEESVCNHYSWKGGQAMLIDTKRNILIEKFDYSGRVNFFSIENTQTPDSSPIKKSFLAKDGSYYSFVDFKKEFKQWLVKELLDNLTLEELLSASYDTINLESKSGWKKIDKTQLITKNFATIKNRLLETLDPSTEWFVSSDGLNPFLYDYMIQDYYNNCGDAKYWKYPTMEIIINHRDNEFKQDHYEFLRTDDGFKLIGLAIKGKNLES